MGEKERLQHQTCLVQLPNLALILFRGRSRELSPTAGGGQKVIQNDAAPFQLVNWKQQPRTGNVPSRTRHAGGDRAGEAIELGRRSGERGLAEEIANQFGRIVPTRILEIDKAQMSILGNDRV